MLGNSHHLNQEIWPDEKEKILENETDCQNHKRGQWLREPYGKD